MDERRTRISHEQHLIMRLRDSLADLPGITISSGQGVFNRLEVPVWGLLPRQQFQYGDLRIETSSSTIVVETESAGGLTNLLKYWPVLASRRPAKRFLLIHVFRLTSADDYVAHRRLWEFTIDRMRDHLVAQHQVLWGEHWEARLLTYRSETDLEQISQLVREASKG